MYTRNCIESSNLSFTATLSKHKPLVFLKKAGGLWFLVFEKRLYGTDDYFSRLRMEPCRVGLSAYNRHAEVDICWREIDQHQASASASDGDLDAIQFPVQGDLRDF